MKLLRVNYDLGCIFLQIVGSTSGQHDFGSTVIGANTLTFLSSMLAPNTEYTFRVAAINGAGGGMFSPDIIVYTSFSGML